MLKVCFTINCMRTHEDFVGYDKILSDGLYQGVELFYPYNVPLIQAGKYTYEVTNLLKKYNVEVVLHLPHGGVNNFVNENGSANEDVLKLMKDASDYANLFGVKKLTLHLGRAWDRIDRKILLDKVIVQVKELCKYVAKNGQTVMIENMPRDIELGYGTEEIEYLITEISKECSNIKFILDTGHANTSDEPVSLYVKKLGKYLYHMHVHDNNGKFDEHKRLHLGNINFEEFFTELNKVGYKELHCLEIIFHDYTELISNQHDIMEYSDYYKD